MLYQRRCVAGEKVGPRKWRVIAPEVNREREGERGREREGGGE